MFNPQEISSNKSSVSRDTALLSDPTKRAYAELTQFLSEVISLEYLKEIVLKNFPVLIFKFPRGEVYKIS